VVESPSGKTVWDGKGPPGLPLKKGGVPETEGNKPRQKKNELKKDQEKKSGKKGTRGSNLMRKNLEVQPTSHPLQGEGPRSFAGIRGGKEVCSSKKKKGKGDKSLRVHTIQERRKIQHDRPGKIVIRKQKKVEALRRPNEGDALRGKIRGDNIGVLQGKTSLGEIRIGQNRKKGGGGGPTAREPAEHG